MTTLDDRLSDVNNMNPTLLAILSLSNSVHEKLTPKILDVRTTVRMMIGGSVLAEILDRKPDLEKLKKSKSPFKWRLGGYGGNMEVYDSPEGVKFIMVTNGYSRRQKDKFKVVKIFPLLKEPRTGLWIPDNRVNWK